MSNEGVDVGRRRFLTTATSVVGGVGAAFWAVPFIRSWEPSARTEAIGAPVEVDVSKIEEGQLVTIEWRKKPVWVLHRTQAQLDTLPKLNDIAKDPQSKRNQQPAEMRQSAAWQKHPLARAIQPKHLVLVAICTHLGCIPEYKPKPGSVGANWKGGFFCPCHGSHYDLAGRVLAGSPAPLNLPVPPYSYMSDDVIRVGELKDGKDATWTPNTW